MLSSSHKALLSLQHCLLGLLGPLRCLPGSCLQHRQLLLGRGCLLLVLVQPLPGFAQAHQHRRLLGSVTGGKLSSNPLGHLAPPLHTHACKGVLLTCHVHSGTGSCLCC